MYKPNSTFSARICLAVFFAAWLLLALPAPTHAAGLIVLDGQFNDWVGQAFIPDPAGDASNQANDILAFYFAANPNDSTAYFMAKRPLTTASTHYHLAIDADNNGIYNRSTDRLVSITYKPVGNHAQVTVDLYSGTGQFLANIASGADWGESKKEGGTMVEWGVSFADLGISTGQPLRMILQSMNGNAVDDDTDEVQWSPADALGWILTGAILLAGTVYLARLRRRKELTA